MTRRKPRHLLTLTLPSGRSVEVYTTQHQHFDRVDGKVRRWAAWVEDDKVFLPDTTDDLRKTLGMICVDALTEDLQPA
jgi:hypothetical protein